MTEDNAPETTTEEAVQGFTVEPTGMSAQVLRGEESAPFFAELERQRKEWMSANPGMEPPDWMSDVHALRQSEIYEREAALEVPTEGVIMEAGEPVLESSEENVTETSESSTATFETPMGRVSICRMVEYRSRTGNYSVPAVVSCTSDSIYQPGVEAGFVPPLSSRAHVHLTVFSPGRTGMRIDAGTQPGAENFIVPSTAVALVDGERVPMPVSENVAGCYQEWDIPYDPDASPGTWRWPTRV